MGVLNIRIKTYDRSIRSENCIIGNYAKQIYHFSKLSNSDKNTNERRLFWWWCTIRQSRFGFQPIRRRCHVCHPIRRSINFDRGKNGRSSEVKRVVFLSFSALIVLNIYLTHFWQVMWFSRPIECIFERNVHINHSKKCFSTKRNKYQNLMVILGSKSQAGYRK